MKLIKLKDLNKPFSIDSCSKALEYIAKNPSKMNDGIGYSYVSGDEYKELLIQEFLKDEFYSNLDYVRSTSYTNMSVSIWNRYIRERIFDTQNQSLIISDLLTSYKTLVNDNNDTIIINSQDYIIDQIRPFTNEYRLKVNCVVLTSVYNNKKTEMLQILDTDDLNNINTYRMILEQLRAKAIQIGGKKGWFPFFKFKNQILSMIDTQLSTVNIQKEIDYGYCLTSHKLQGSTFENIFVDGFDICNPINKWGKYYKNDVEFRNRLLYVALSRASHKAIIRF